MISIIIVDDHAIVRLGLKHLLLNEYPFALIDEASDGESFLELALKREYSLAIIDLLLPGRSGIDILKMSKSLYPKMPVLVLTVQQENDIAVRAFQTGASSFLNKETDPKELIRAVNLLLSGKNYVRPSVANLLLHNSINHQPLFRHQALSNREFEVMRLIASGETLSEIAARMSLSVSSISTYRQRILTKMNIRSNAEIIRYAMQNKLIT